MLWIAVRRGHPLIYICIFCFTDLYTMSVPKELLSVVIQGSGVQKKETEIQILESTE